MRVASRTRPHATIRAYSSFKVYTRTGDGGSSSLFNGERRSKNDLVFAALGDTDELNASIGAARAQCEVAATAHPTLGPMLPQLDHIQSRLLDVGSAVATPRSRSNEAQLVRAVFDEEGEETQQLERWLDAMDVQLPPLRNFILPSGGLVSSSLHVARAVCRRAERSVTPLVLEEECSGRVAVFVNRLSDYLFVAARFSAMATAGTETPYQKPRPPRPSRFGAERAAE